MDSYNNLGIGRADASNDDLPGNATNPNPVNVLQDYPYSIFSGGGSDEGRAMLQIVHDVAPKAKLAFRTGFISEGDFAFGVRQLVDNANCDVIVDDITYITEPFFRDGFVANRPTMHVTMAKLIFPLPGILEHNPIQRISTLCRRQVA